LKDTVHAYLVKGARFVGMEEFPEIDSCNQIPKRLIEFSQALYTNDYNQFVHFYEPDEQFERFWHNPRQYLSRLKKFKGIISPDFSVCRDMPLNIQQYNTYRNRALAYWCQIHDIPVIPNVRWGDERSYSFCFDGVPPQSVIAIGTHGCVKQKDDLLYAIKGVRETIQRLAPRAIVIYGALPVELLGVLRQHNVPFTRFNSDIAAVFNQRKNAGNTTLFLPGFECLEEGV
jgi:hypothetical protein